MSSIAPGGPDIPHVDLAGTSLAAGGEVFRAQCAACHSWSGVGGALYQRAAPSLRLATATQIAEAMRTGPGQMPAFGTAAIPADQLDDVVAYVRYLDHPDNRGGQPLWYLGPVAEGAAAIILGLGALMLGDPVDRIARMSEQRPGRECGTRRRDRRRGRVLHLGARGRRRSASCTGAAASRSSRVRCSRSRREASRSD